MPDALWMNASGGVPAYNARELRAGLAMFTQFDGGPMISSRMGVRPGGDQLKVSLSGSTILANAGVCVVFPGGASESGPYICGFTTTQTVGTLTAAHATLVRVDIVYVKVYDTDEDGSGQRTAVVEKLDGTPGSGQPATPAGTLLLASINVPQSGGGAATVTDARTFMPRGPEMQIFTASGSFAKPHWARAVRVRLVGGGGGGGGAGVSSAGQSAVGGGGGGGGYAEEWIPVNLLAVSETVTVGAAGAASTAGANPGGNGGTSSFGAHLSATGGTGGAGMGSSTTAIVGGGAGGTGSGGNVNIAGQPGETSRVVGGVPVTAPGGGSSQLGAGAGQAQSSTTINGSDGQLYGGGGGGALNRDTGGTPARSGGAGAAGIVIVEII